MTPQKRINTAIIVLVLLSLTGCEKPLSEEDKVRLANSLTISLARVEADKEAAIQAANIAAAVDERIRLRQIVADKEVEAMKLKTELEGLRFSHEQTMAKLAAEKIAGIIDAVKPYFGYILVAFTTPLCLFLILKFFAYRTDKEYEFKHYRERNAHELSLMQEKRLLLESPGANDDGDGTPPKTPTLFLEYRAT